MRNKPALTASDVQQMAAACRTEAQNNKWNVTVAIVDDAGFLLYLERLDGAGPMTAEVATAKARTAAVRALAVATSAVIGPAPSSRSR